MAVGDRRGTPTIHAARLSEPEFGTTAPHASRRRFAGSGAQMRRQKKKSTAAWPFNCAENGNCVRSVAAHVRYTVAQSDTFAPSSSPDVVTEICRSKAPERGQADGLHSSQLHFRQPRSARFSYPPFLPTFPALSDLHCCPTFPPAHDRLISVQGSMKVAATTLCFPMTGTCESCPKACTQ